MMVRLYCLFALCLLPSAASLVALHGEIVADGNIDIMLQLVLRTLGLSNSVAPWFVTLSPPKRRQRGRYITASLSARQSPAEETLARKLDRELRNPCDAIWRSHDALTILATAFRRTNRPHLALHTYELAAKAAISNLWDHLTALPERKSTGTGSGHRFAQQLKQDEIAASAKAADSALYNYIRASESRSLFRLPRNNVTATRLDETGQEEPESAPLLTALNRIQSWLTPSQLQNPRAYSIPLADHRCGTLRLVVSAGLAGFRMCKSDMDASFGECSMTFNSLRQQVLDSLLQRGFSDQCGVCLNRSEDSCKSRSDKIESLGGSNPGSPSPGNILSPEYMQQLLPLASSAISAAAVGIPSFGIGKALRALEPAVLGLAQSQSDGSTHSLQDRSWRERRAAGLSHAIILQPYVPRQLDIGIYRGKAEKQLEVHPGMLRLRGLALAGILTMTSADADTIVLSPDSTAGAHLSWLIEFIGRWICVQVSSACVSAAAQRTVLRIPAAGRLRPSSGLDDAYQGIADVLTVVNADTVLTDVAIDGEKQLFRQRQRNCTMGRVAGGLAVAAIHRRELRVGRVSPDATPCLSLVQSIVDAAIMRNLNIWNETVVSSPAYWGDWLLSMTRESAVIKQMMEGCKKRASLGVGILAADLRLIARPLVPRTDSQDAWMLPGRVNTLCSTSRVAFSELGRITAHDRLGANGVDGRFVHASRQARLDVVGGGLIFDLVHLHVPGEGHSGSFQFAGERAQSTKSNWSYADGLVQFHARVC